MLRRVVGDLLVAALIVSEWTALEVWVVPMTY